MKNKLKPCPFCGDFSISGVEEHGENAGEWYIYCTGCFTRTAYYNTEAEAIAAWNRRDK